MKSTMIYDIRGEGSSSLELDVYDVVGERSDGSGVTAKKIAGILRRHADARKITLRVNSVGGSVFDGFAIYQQLADHRARVEAHVDGLAASIASLIIMAADEITIAPQAMVMVHNPWSVGVGDADDMRKAAETLDKIRDSMADAYAARTGLGRDRVVAMMEAETWMNAAEAVAQGFADRIAETKKPAAQALAGLDLSSFARVPNGFSLAVAQAQAATTRPVSAEEADYLSMVQKFNALRPQTLEIVATPKRERPGEMREIKGPLR